MVYLSANGEVLGQFEERDLPSSLAAGKVPPDSFFWREGMPEWRPLRELVLPPRPVRVQPAPEPPAVSRQLSDHGQPVARAAAEQTGARPIAPAIAQKKPFVPRTAVATSQQALSAPADVPAPDAARKPGVPTKPTSLWKRLFRRSAAEPPQPAAAPATTKPAQPAPSTSRLDSLASKKPEAASPVPAVTAMPAAEPVPLSPARNVGPPAAGNALSAKRVVLPPTKQSTRFSGELEAQTVLTPAKPSQAAGKEPLPQVRQATTIAPAPETIAGRQASPAQPSAPAGRGFGKQNPSPLAEKIAAPLEIPARAPGMRPTGKPPQPGGGPELMLAAAKSRGRGGRKGLLIALILLVLAALGAAAWWFFPVQPPALRGEVRLGADDGTEAPAAGAAVYLVSREKLTARWRDQLAEAQSRAAEFDELLKQAGSVHREKVLALELASRTSELADEYNMPDAAELRAARDAAQAEEATALAEVEKLRREKESIVSAAALLQAPPDALDQTQTDASGAFALTLPASTEGLAVFVLAGANGENAFEAYGWLVPLAGPDETTKPAVLSPANVLDAEQIREIVGAQP